MCFIWCVARALNLVEIHAERISNLLREQAEELNMRGNNFPVKLQDIDKFEKQNPVTLNVFGFEGEIHPLRISKEKRGREPVNLLLISDRKKNHYCLIKDMSRLFSSETNQHQHKNHFCLRCLNPFATEKSLKKHMEYCETNEAVKMEMPEEDSFIEFENFNRSMRVPFIVYADFESLIKPIETFELNPEKSYTKKCQEHKPSSFCYNIKCFDDKGYSQKPVKYTMESEEEDVAQKFVDMLDKDVKSIYKIFGKPKKMIFGGNEKIEFENATKCWLCNGEFGDEKKVRDHCHFTGKFRGAAHNACNLKYKTPKFIPVVFHNLSGYDSHLFVKNLGVSEGKITCIPTNEKKYISFSKGIEVGKYVDKKGEEKPIKIQLRFIDSFKFMALSLDKLSKKMEKEDLKITKKQYEGEKLKHELKSLKEVNNQKITLREQIDRKKLEHILKHPDDFDLSSRTTRTRKLGKEGQITLLKENLARCNSNGEQLIEYHQRNNFGRYWISENLGLQNMKRRMRHTICKDLMYDIDMKNAHPTLLSWYCHENGIKCTGLDEYILHREEKIKNSR